jgi:hypothetical protein
MLALPRHAAITLDAPILLHPSKAMKKAESALASQDSPSTTTAVLAST